MTDCIHAQTTTLHRTSQSRHAIRDRVCAIATSVRVSGESPAGHLAASRATAGAADLLQSRYRRRSQALLLLGPWSRQRQLLDLPAPAERRNGLPYRRQIRGDKGYPTIIASVATPREQQ